MCSHVAYVYQFWCIWCYGVWEQRPKKRPRSDLRRDERIIGECNETYERYVFNHQDQESNESIDAYVTALRKLVKTCNYGSLTDSLIRDRMVVGINDNSACKKLLQTSKLTLGQCIDICRSSQTSARQLKQMNQEEDNRKKAVDKKRTKVPEKSQNKSQEHKFNFFPDIILSLRTAL